MNEQVGRAGSTVDNQLTYRPGGNHDYGGPGAMGRLRLITTAGLLGSLVMWGPAPAFAADPPVDVASPVVTSTGLVDGQVVGRGQRLRPSWADDTGVTRVEVVLNGAVLRSYLPGQWDQGVYLAVPANLHDTEADVTIRAFDAAGNQGEATSRVRVDTQGPNATLSPPFESFIGGVVTFTATDVSSDLAQIVLFDHASGREVAKATAAPWSMTWDTTGRTGDTHVHFELTDKVGNVSFAYGFYGIDNTGPTISGLQFPQQADHAVVDGRISGKARLTALVDGPSPLDRVEWWVDGTLRSTYPVPSSGSYPTPYFDWDTGLANGTALLEVRAHDILGHRATATRNIVIDNTGPTITSITPANRALVRGGQFKTTVKGADPSGIREAYLLDATAVNNAPFTVFASAGKDGPRTLTWTLTDRLGNQSTAKRVVIVDNTKPKVKITKAPGNGAKVSKTVKVTVSATDRNGINRVELLINGRVIATDTKASYAFSVNPKKYGKKIKIQIRGYDKAGNVTKTTTRTWRR
ncbi:Ig-like domain-containing protein [Actinoplanes sp. NPDC049118]|uniref:Ig-like domain-containing protein n=1 Tax=Actinoplanes sp. NPDC049118 TaxID=3155769 RepID=UPI00340FC71A